MRVLFWNILQFTLSRIYDASGQTEAERRANAFKSMANLRYILGTIRQADPDIFVVIEAKSEQGRVECLAKGQGADGLRYLFAALHGIEPNWYLVPPLKTNPKDPHKGTHTETVGVFWRADRLRFTGPLLWPRGPKNAAGPPTGDPAESAAYPAPWNATVPQGPPVVTQAALCRFYAADLTEIDFHEKAHRRPYLTEFQEIRSPQRPTDRIIRLFVVHLKPGDADPAIASTKVSQMVRQQFEPQQNELNLVVGDFNIDLIAPSWLERAGLEAWGPGARNAGYERLAPAPLGPTMINRNDQSLPGTYKAGRKCMDFGFVKYGAGTRPQAGPSAVIVERVAGTPAAGPLPAFTTDMTVPLGVIARITDARVQEPLFRNPLNYGHISPPKAGTSDHLPVLVQV